MHAHAHPAHTERFTDILFCFKFESYIHICVYLGVRVCVFV